MPKSSAFDLTEAKLKGHHADCETYDDLASWMVRQLEDGLATRGTTAEDVQYRWLYYEQGRTRRSSPWPDAADLTSPYATEFVDAILARLMDTIMVEPLWIVEGWGESTARAPFVEEFHQRAQEQERLQTYLREVLLRALIEPAGILEVSEASDVRITRETIKAKLQLDPLTNAPILDEDAKPLLVKDEQGNFAEATDPNEPQAEVVVDRSQPVRLGPAYDVVPYLDYVRFPGHARTKSEIWGYGKRFWRRVSELKMRVQQGVYDKAAVEELGEADERMTGSQAGVEPTTTTVADQQGPIAQKELWEFSLLADLDGTGERWWLATVSREHTKLLRLKADDRSTRFLEFVPFPKPGTRDGYSIVEKMMTLLEEDTALRNMSADRLAMGLGFFKVMQNALWDPYEQAIGPFKPVTVRDPNEITWQQIPDVPASLQIARSSVRADLERGVGLNDVSGSGRVTEADKTLGEVRLAAGYSEIRVKAITTAIQETLEELGQARHAIWLRVLETMPQGLPLPSSVMQGLDARGINTQSIADGRVTKAMLEGQFWFKPRGSVDTANLDMQAQLMTRMLQVLGPLAQSNPYIRAIFSTPQAAKALVEQLLRVHRWPDKQAFLGSESQRVVTNMSNQNQMMQSPEMQALMAMAGAGPGAQGMLGAAAPMAAEGAPPEAPMEPPIA